ncbi:MAG: exodeoxyribonuclease VII small subunit [Clostridiales bacterium]
MTKNNDLTFEAAMKELEATVKSMENGDLGLDELLGKFETGIGLLRCCEEKLGEAEAKIEILSKKAIEEPKPKAKPTPKPKVKSQFEVEIQSENESVPLPQEPPMDEEDSLF